MSKFSYLGWVIGRRLAGQSRDCPFCGSSETRLECRKKGVVELRSCSDCGLRYRWPKPEPEALEHYYQEEYDREETTDLPGDDALKQLTETGFKSAGINDMSERIGVLSQLRQTVRTLDFGCSKGYGTWQLRAAGYDVTGFEISRPRAGYSRDKLDLSIIDDPAELDAHPDGSRDIIFTSHVLEHLPDLKDPFAAFARLLKKDGLLIAFVPNGGGRSAQELGCGWDPLIDQDHVLALDTGFIARYLPGHGFAPPRFNTDPYDRPSRDASEDLPGDELCIVAERT